MKLYLALASVSLALPLVSFGLQNPFAPAASSAAQAPADKISLEEAIRLALQHNHALQVMRSTILQSQALETTANLRPNPVLSFDAQFLPIFNPSQFSSDYIDNSAQFDAGIGYLFERGKKRQHRLQAAQDQTTVVRSHVNDSQRQLTYNVAQQFIQVLLAESILSFAQQDLDSFQNTVEISNPPALRSSIAKAIRATSTSSFPSPAAISRASSRPARPPSPRTSRSLRATILIGAANTANFSKPSPSSISSALSPYF